MKIRTQKGFISIEECDEPLIFKSDKTADLKISTTDSGFAIQYHDKDYIAELGEINPVEDLKKPCRCKGYVLYNATISANFRNDSFMLLPSEIIGAFAYWASSQSYSAGMLRFIHLAADAFKDYIESKFKDPKIPQVFTYSELEEILDEKNLSQIPAILELNSGHGWIDLGALSRNMFYMILREQITQPL